MSISIWDYIDRIKERIRRYEFAYSSVGYFYFQRKYKKTVGKWHVIPYVKRTGKYNNVTSFIKLAKGSYTYHLYLDNGYCEDKDGNARLLLKYKI